MKYLLLFAACILLFSINTFSQNIHPDILQKQWKASWIEVPDEPSNGYGIYLFRKKINLPSKPSSFRIHVSADNRYKLYVNDKMVSLGPARGDLTHWNFETVDIAQYLNDGNNIVSALVWNEAQWRPEAQISFRTGLIIQGATAAEEVLNTDASWKCIRDDSYKPIRFVTNEYYVCGPGEQVTMSMHPRNWRTASFDDAAWKNARDIFPGNPKTILGAFGIPVGWLLVPSSIPQMEHTPQRLKVVRKAEGVTIPASFPAAKTAVTIPANTNATILLDQEVLTNAYPTIIFSGGKNGSVTLGYAEALYTKVPAKGNRNDINGKIFYGRKDSLISDGTAGQQFTTLNWRTYRYLQVQVTTKDEPLTIDDLYGTFTGFPFVYKAAFESDNPELKTIMETGWRTARLCAVETYMDCPYYEQLQYIGDGRIQGLISLYNTGDDRLVKNAINLIDHSRIPEGLTESRHPSFSPQYIPNFSLWYIGMLHDYLMYGKDVDFIKSKLGGAREILKYFHSYQKSDGSLANFPYWMFTDWVVKTGWVNGAAPYGTDGSNALNDLQLLLGYQVAADMEAKSGIKEYATIYNGYAAQLKTTIRKKYWDTNKQLFADRPEKDMFSQHANALAILTGLVTDNEATTIAKKILADTSLATASIYFKFYLHQALIKAGLGNDYVKWLDSWRDNLKMGLTTWGETPDINITRSDCHAWGSSPNIEFLRTVLGIDSDAPGFAKIKVTPHPGTLNNVKGEVPHPYGKIAAEYEKKSGKWTMNISLPEKLTGSLVWNGKTYPLKAGKNEFNF
jgi:hypothetical protein